MKSHESLPALQSILDEQGYIVLGCRPARKIGDVIDNIGTPDHDPPEIPAKTVVVGLSNLEEFRAQAKRWKLPFSEFHAARYDGYVKVIAE
jgi:hypothetical protein